MHVFGAYRKLEHNSLAMDTATTHDVHVGAGGYIQSTCFTVAADQMHCRSMHH
jgi:hypothetical protein